MRSTGVGVVMRVILSVLLVAAALGLAGAAGAKGLPPERACGDSACFLLNGEDHSSAIVIDGNAARPAPPVAGYYRLDYSTDGSGPPYDFSHLFIPSQNLIARDTEAAGRVRWFALYGAGLDHLREAISELEPFPAPERWPASIETAMPIAGADGDNGWDSRPWLAAALAGVMLLGFGLAVRRLRLRRPTTA